MKVEGSTFNLTTFNLITFKPRMHSKTWNSLIAGLPGAHVLQTCQWGQVKARYGWEPIYSLWYLEPQPGSGTAAGGPPYSIRSISLRGEPASEQLRDSSNLAAAALVLRRALPLPGFAGRLSVLYAPRGPLLRDWGDPVLRRRVLSDLRSLAEREGAVFIKLDPELVLGTRVPGATQAGENRAGQEAVQELQALGWRFSDEQVQFRNTVLIDLSPPEEALLAGMKQKTRYNIRLAQRKGVTVRSGGEADLDLLYRMYAETSVRDGFVIREEAYYLSLWTVFLRSGMAQPLIAEVEGAPVAALILFQFAGRAWYLYGMSRDLHRERMPNYLLQWEAIRRSKAAGCQVYDLWGAPDRFDEGDPMWGVYRFKEGLGGTVVRHIGAWDLPIRPFYYRLYTQTLPRVLGILRAFGKAKTQRMVNV